MTNLATLRGTNTAGFTGGVRRHVVVVHVPPGVFRGEGVKLLLHIEHVESRHAQNLGLAALEQG